MTPIIETGQLKIQLRSVARMIPRREAGKRAFHLAGQNSIEPEVIEPTLSEIAGNRNLAYRFTVRFRLPDGASLARSYVEALVEAEKPAFAGCTIEINGA